MYESEYTDVDPCVGCGFCCSRSVCILGQLLFKAKHDKLPCSLLYFKDGRHWCSMLDMSSGKDKEIIIEHLGIGEGCCSNLNAWRRNVVDRTKGCGR